MQISGNVVDDLTGKPIGGANVILYSCEGKKISNSSTEWDGQFSFKVLKGKCFVVGASQVNYPENRKSVAKNNQVEIRLKRDRSLEILVLDYDNRVPVKNAKVRINENLIGQTPNDGTVTKELTNEKELNVDVSLKGYLRQSVKVNTDQSGKVRQTILLMKIKMNMNIPIDNFYFEKNSWNIIPAAETALDKLITIMNENPSIVVEVGSHTDSQGFDQYNLTLSQKRSEMAVFYILSKGIPIDRISAKGYGETQLLNRCKNDVLCTDQEHKVNERTEFKIVGIVK
jgi:outer membrane protein OmpA-like peptidoglycan-associated protein